MSEYVPADASSAETWRIVVIARGLGAKAVGALYLAAATQPGILAAGDELIAEPMEDDGLFRIDWELSGRGEASALNHAVGSTLQLAEGLSAPDIAIVDAQAGRIDLLDPEARYDWRSLDDRTAEARAAAELLTGTHGAFADVSVESFLSQ